MKDEAKTKAQLINELRQLRQQNEEVTAERRNIDEGDHIGAVLRSLNAEPDIQAAFPKITPRIQALTDCDFISLASFENDLEWLVIVAVTRPLSELSQDTRLRLSDSAASTNIMAGQAHMTPDLAAKKDFALEGALCQAGYRSALYRPLQVKEEVIGMMVLTWEQPAGYDEAKLSWLGLITDAIALALEKEVLFALLRRSEARYRVVSEVTSDFAYAFRVEPDGSLVLEWVTDAFTLITGFTLDEIEARGGWPSLIYPQDIPTIRQHIKTLLAGQVDICEARIIAKNGDMHWLRAYGRLVRDKAREQFVHIYGAVQNITEQKQAEEALSRNVKELQALYKTSLGINTHSDLSTLLPTIVQRATTLLGTEQGSLFLLKPDGKTLEVVAAHHQQIDHVGDTLRLGEGLIGRVAEAGELMMVADYNEWSDKLDLYDGPIGRVMAVPLKQGDRVLGVLTVLDSEKIGEFSEDQVRLLGLFAAQASTAITKTRLVEDLHNQAHQLTLLNNLAQKISGDLKTTEICTIVAQHLHSAFGYLNVTIFTVDPTSQQLVAQVNVGAYADIIQPGEYRQALGEGIIGQVAQTGEPLVVNDTRKHPDFFELEQMTIYSEAAVPLKTSDRLIGVLNTDSDQLDAFDDSDLTLLTTIGRQLAIALEKARLFEGERRHRREAETLRQISLYLTSILNLEQVLEIILTQLEQVVTYDTACIFLLENKHLRAVAGRGFPDSTLVLAQTRPLDNALFQEIQQTRRALVLADAQAEPRFEHWGGTELVRGWMGAPLLAHGALIGFLSVDSRQTAIYGQAETELVQAFANQAAIAIENARLLEDTQQRLQEISALQQSSLAFTQLLNLEAVGQKIVETVDSWQAYRRCAVVIVEGPEQKVRLLAHSPMGLDPESLEVHLAEVRHWIESRQGIAAWVALHGETVHIGDVNSDSRYVAADPATQSELCVPLKIGARTIGALNVESEKPDAFTEHDEHLLSTLANQAAIAIENARLHETVRQSEERYRTISELTSDYAFVTRVEADGTFQTEWVAGAYTRITGFTPEELQQRGGLMAQVHPDDLSVVEKRMQTLLAGQEDTSEFRFITKNGPVRWLRSHGHPEWFESQGRVGRIYFATRDVTERKQAEKALRQSEQRYRQLFEHAPISVWEEDGSDLISSLAHLRQTGVNDFRAYFEQYPEEVANLATKVKVIDVNQATVTLYEADHKEVLLRDINTVFVEDSYDVYREQLLAITEGKTEFEGEIINQTFQGRKINLILRMSTIPGDDTTNLKLLVSLIDITQQKQIEQTLRVSESRLAGLIDVAADAIISIDEEQQITLFNKGAEQIFGYAAAEVMGQSLDLLLPQRSVIRHQHHITEFARSGVIARRMGERQEIVGRRRDGKEFPAEASISKLELGEQTIFTVILRDITERKQAENEIKQHHRELAALLEIGQELTRQLDLEKLLEHIVYTSIEMIPVAEAASLWLFDEQRQELAARAWSGHDDEEMVGLTVPSDFSLFGIIYRDHQPHIINDATAEPAFVSLGQPILDTVRSVLGVPLLIEQQFAGILFADNFSQTHAFDDNHLQLLQSLASEAAIALRNARLFESEQERTRALSRANFLISALSRVMTSIEVSVSLDEVLETMGRELKRLGINSLLALFVPDTKELTIHYLSLESKVLTLAEKLAGLTLEKFRFTPERFPIYDELIEKQQPVFVAPMYSLVRSLLPHLSVPMGKRLFRLIGIAPEAGAIYHPLIVEERVMGLLAFWGADVKEEDLITTEAFAHQIAAAIEKIRLFGAERRQTATLARSNTIITTLSTVAIRLESMSAPDSILKTMGAGLKQMGLNAFVANIEPDNKIVTFPYISLNSKLLASIESLTGPRLSSHRPVELERVPFLHIDYEQGQPLFIPDSLSRVYTTLSYLPEGKIKRVARLLGVTPETHSICLPLMDQEQYFDILYLWGEDLREDDLPIFLVFASHVVATLKNTRLLHMITSHEHELLRLSVELINAQENERKRLAYELHDELGQALTAIGINLEAIDLELPPNVPPTAGRRLAESISLADQTLAQVRELSLELRPSMLDDLGLPATLNWYVNRYSARTNVAVELNTADFDGRLNTGVETALYRVIQEALTNVARHAQANRVYVRLAHREASLTLSIEDDGEGFTYPTAANHEALKPGLGLIGMRERVIALGGRFDIQSQPGRGTRLEVEIPMPTSE